MSSFDTATVLITGAASGIGLALAERLKDARRLILVDQDAEALGNLSFGNAATHVGDVTSEAFWETIDLTGLTHAVVNAGVASGAPIAELAFEEWRRVLSINLDGAFLTLRAAMRAIADRGSIVVTASASAVKAEVGTAAYGASKAGLVQLMRVAAKEGAPRGIRVNAIAPGGVETPIWRDVPFFQDIVREKGEAAAFDAMAAMATPLGRYAKAGEIAAQIAFLLGDDSATITGALLASDGGYTL